MNTTDTDFLNEDYVSFETAKLLKEKGFKGFSIINIYDEDAVNAYIKELEEKHLPYSSDDPKLKEFYYTIPTLQMAMKWLREKYEIDIIISRHIRGKRTTFFDRIEKRTYIEHQSKRNLYPSYEEACEAAIKYCLRNLI